MTILPAFFRASVYALAAACFDVVAGHVLGYVIDPVSVFALILSGYFMGAIE